MGGLQTALETMGSATQGHLAGLVRLVRAGLRSAAFQRALVMTGPVCFDGDARTP